MKLKEADLRDRCRERGYEWADIQPCLIEYLGDGWYEVDVEHASYPRKKDKKPPLIKRVANFATAAAQHVAAGAPMASDEEIARRHAICVGCEFFDGKACMKCGCPIVREKQYLSKLSWADQACPVGKWGPVDNRATTE